MSQAFELSEFVSAMATSLGVQPQRQLHANSSLQHWLCSLSDDESPQMRERILLHLIAHRWPEDVADANALLAFIELHTDTFEKLEAEEFSPLGVMVDVVLEPLVGIAWTLDVKHLVSLDALAQHKTLTAGELSTVLIGVFALAIRFARNGWCIGDVSEPARVLVSDLGSITLLPIDGMHTVSDQKRSAQRAPACLCRDPQAQLQQLSHTIANDAAFELVNSLVSTFDYRLDDEDVLEAFVHLMGSSVDAVKLTLPATLASSSSRDLRQTPLLRDESLPASGSAPHLLRPRFGDRSSTRERLSNALQLLLRVRSRQP